MSQVPYDPRSAPLARPSPGGPGVRTTPSGAKHWATTTVLLTSFAVFGCQPPKVGVSRQEISQGWTVSGVDTFSAGFPAQVPGTVHTDLLASGLIPDPFWRDNEMRLQWVGEEDWTYRNTLQVSSEVMDQEVVELVFHGLDTFAEVLLNDEPVLRADNMFREWKAEVGPLLLPGTNTLEVRLSSPLPPALEARQALPYTLPAGNDRGDPPTRVFVRKAAYHYGWDWGPRFVTSGIWRPVELVGWSGARLTNLKLETRALTDSAANLVAQVTVEVTPSEAERRRAGGGVPATLSLSSPEGAFDPVFIQSPLDSGENHFDIPLTILNPKRWWPAGMGEQPLYTVKAELDAGLRMDTTSTRIGLRSLELITQPDSIGESFFFEVNGVPVFMKGANIIPLDHFTPRVSQEKYERLFDDVVAANMNMLRVWGGGIYEEEIFYELADERGILIWQDFMFANGMYPGDSAFLANVRAEAVHQVRRLRNHPSIALWCGNNEMEEGWQRWGWARAYENPADSAAVRNAYDAIFHQILPEVVAELDPDRRYWASSPSLGWGDPESLERGDSHYWGVWHGREPFEVYAEKLPRFASEYGFQAFPPMATVEGFARPGDLSLFNPALLVHQKHPVGNELIREYMERWYPLPVNFQDFVYVSQLLQAQGMKTAFEAHRRAKPRTMGTLYWQLNDTWPVVSWSSLDFFGRWKALHYAARDAFAPVLLSVARRGDTLEVWGISDRSDPTRGTMTLELMDFRGTPLWQAPLEVSIPPNSARRLWQMATSELLAEVPPTQVVFRSALRPEPLGYASPDGPDPDEVAIPSVEALFYFGPPKELALEIPVIQVDWEEGPEGLLLTLSSDILAKSVYLQMNGDQSPPPGGVFSDNFFDLLPGRPRTLSLQTDLTREAAERGLTIRTLAEVPREGSPVPEGG